MLQLLQISQLFDVICLLLPIGIPIQLLLQGLIKQIGDRMKSVII